MKLLISGFTSEEISEFMKIKYSEVRDLRLLVLKEYSAVGVLDLYIKSKKLNLVNVQKESQLTRKVGDEI